MYVCARPHGSEYAAPLLVSKGLAVSAIEQRSFHDGICTVRAYMFVALQRLTNLHRSMVFGIAFYSELSFLIILGQRKQICITVNINQQMRLLTSKGLMSQQLSTAALIEGIDVRPSRRNGEMELAS